MKDKTFNICMSVAIALGIFAPTVGIYINAPLGMVMFCTAFLIIGLGMIWDGV